MTITLDVSRLRSEHVAFSYSPMQEVMDSLHVLCTSKRFPLHIRWVIGARKKMSRALKADFDRFRLCYQTFIITFWDMHKSDCLQTFDEELRAFQRAGVGRFMDELAFIVLERPLTFARLRKDKQLGEEATAHIAERYPASASVFRDAFKNSRQVHRRFCEFVAEYWRACLQDEWPDMEARLAQYIAERAHALQRRAGIAKLLNSLGPGIYINPKTGIGTKESNFDATVRFADDDVLFLTPSCFLWPRLHYRQETPPTISYPVQALRSGAQPAMPLDRMVNIARAIGDPTRLRILKLIRWRPVSTRELAGLLHLSEPGVSKHLKQLVQSGLAIAEREGYFVMYCLSPHALSEFGNGVRKFLDLV